MQWIIIKFKFDIIILVALYRHVVVFSPYKIVFIFNIYILQALWITCQKEREKNLEEGKSINFSFFKQAALLQQQYLQFGSTDFNWFEFLFKTGPLPPWKIPRYLVDVGYYSLKLKFMCNLRFVFPESIGIAFCTVV